MDQPINQLRSTALITVDASGKVLMEGQAIPAEELPKRLRTIGLSKDALITIRPSAEAPMEAVTPVVGALKQAGYDARLDSAEAPALEKADPPSQP
jgi:biopolymer transport protein ExbD